MAVPKTTELGVGATVSGKKCYANNGIAGTKKVRGGEQILKKIHKHLFCIAYQ